MKHHHCRISTNSDEPFISIVSNKYYFEHKHNTTATRVVTNMKILTGILVYWITATAAAADACTFPTHWQGSWLTNAFGSGANLVVEISGNTITRKGRCIESSRNKYYLLQKTITQDDILKHCYTCVIITVRHTNLIQFKEKTQCNPRRTDRLLNDTCGLIDANVDLKTLLKKNYVPISCPEVMQKKSKFVYNNEDGDCDSADSLMQKCASDKRLQITFGQCLNQEAIGEKEIQCLASWKEGGNWLYVKYGREGFRCMYYDATSRMMGISSDATCTGISNINLAPTYLTWTEEPTASRLQMICNYPSWFSQQEWTDLQAEQIYRYDLSTNELVVDKQIFAVESYTETTRRHTCYRSIIETAEEARYVTKVIDGCSNGYQCVVMKKKSDSVIELITGELSTSPDDACRWKRQNSARAQTRLLTVSNAKTVNCPVTGIYNLQSTTGRCFPTMEMGCGDPSSIVIRGCGTIETEFLCLTSWKEESTNTNNLVISTKVHPRSGNCYRYRLENQDVVIEIDEQCNHHAPQVIDSTYVHLPFRLPPAKKKCLGVNKNSNREYQTFTDDVNNVATHPYSNMLLIILLLVLAKM